MVFLIFICLGAPLLLMQFLLDHKGRILIGFLLIGCFTCLGASTVNKELSELLMVPNKDFAGHIAPICEEVVKASPVVLFGLLFPKKNEYLLTIGLSVGFGFAILENAYYIDTTYNISLFWAAARGFSTALMHGSSTAIVAYGMSFVRSSHLLTATGTFALLCSAITYHSIYNIMLFSPYYQWVLLLPIVLYSLFLLYHYRSQWKTPVILHKYIIH